MSELRRLIAVLALVPTALVGLACGGGSSAAVSAYDPPVVAPGDDGWETYVDPPTYDAETAEGVAPGDRSPEAAVVHFYASRLRDDRRYRDVLVPEPSDRLERKLDTYDDWKFRAFRLVGRKATSADRYWVEIWFEIDIDGDVDDGTDEVTVRRVGDGWRIEQVPT